MRISAGKRVKYKLHRLWDQGCVLSSPCIPSSPERVPTPTSEGVNGLNRLAHLTKFAMTSYVQWLYEEQLRKQWHVNLEDRLHEGMERMTENGKQAQKNIGVPMCKCMLP